MRKYTLTAPIEAGGEEIREIEYREPTAKDVKQIGFPISTGERLDMAVMHKYICTLAALPPSTVDKLSAADFMALSLEIVNFFGVSPQQG